MAHGYFIIEQWRDKKWVTVCHVDGDRSVTDALEELERRRRPGFFRVVQMQRMIWAEKKNGKLKLRKWHAITPDTLARTAKAFDRDGGKWPQT
ncbi:MAG TPA: hypothetical protein VLT36_15040 [Candidatus Dormibacteraeota bacterium]|nr:hypothetical protein [Candidatus Dormibacteraeota bacterium]